MLGWFKKKFGKAASQETEKVQEEPVAVESPVESDADSHQLQEAFAKEADQLSQKPVEVESFMEVGGEAQPPLEVQDEKPEKKAGLFRRLSEGLAKTRNSLIKRVDAIFLGKREIDAELFEELEEILITADLGVKTTLDILDHAREQVKRRELNDPQALKVVLRDRITEYLLSSDKPADLVMPNSGPFVIMVLGVNGVGKTTSIGKIAYKFVNSGQKVLLVAADTFRAAAVEQLQVWGKRIGVDVVAQQAGADPSSVVFDGLDHAKSNNVDVVIVDTAGRLHTKVNLMEELKKIKRVMDKKLPGAPHEVMLVLDATTGQNAISQARLFNEAVDITGLTLTKLDGTAKGGIVVNICHEFNIPIRFIGIGEQLDDLRDFDPKEFVEALFAGDNS